jgi:hypothetical protein
MAALVRQDLMYCSSIAWALVLRRETRSVSWMVEVNKCLVEADGVNVKLYGEIGNVERSISDRRFGDLQA